MRFPPTLLTSFLVSAVMVTCGSSLAASASAAAPPKFRGLAELNSGVLTVTWPNGRRGIATVELRTALRAPKGVRRRSFSVPFKRGIRNIGLGAGTAVLGSKVTYRGRYCAKAAGKKRCGAWSKSLHPTAVTISGPTSNSELPTTPTAPAPSGEQPTIGGCPLFPATYAMNQDVSSLPVDANSANYLQSIGLNGHVHPDFGAADLGQGPGGFGIPYRVVPAAQPLVPLAIGPDGYADESNLGSVPIPTDTAVEGGASSDGDRHVLVVQQGDCKLYELGRAFPGDGRWTADVSAVWNLTDGSSPGRQTGWTSADAAGLPILPGLARYDEVAAGAIHHALRFTVSKTQQAYIAPANHWTGSSRDANLPPMGLRLRMRADYDTSGMHGQSLVIATALKRYGMIVADNGSPWYISGAPSTQWNDDDLGQLKAVPGSAFEVVQTGTIVRP